MDKLQEQLTKSILEFRKARNWEQFHSGKDISMCLSIEANELMELFLWKNEDEVDKEKLKDEIGDVFYSILLLCHQFEIDLKQAFKEKMKKNELKYPINEYFGSNKKYNE